MSLCDLPPEVLFHICYYLDISTISNLKIVCKSINGKLSDEYFWKKRARLQYSGATFIGEEDGHFKASHALYEVQRNQKFLEDIGSDAIETVDLDTQGDLVLHMKFIDENVFVAGLMKGHISLWNASRSQDHMLSLLRAHWDEVSGIEVFPNRNFCTGSYDRTVKIWDPEHDCPTSTFQYESSCYSVSACYESSLIAVGFKREFVLQDIRQQEYSRKIVCSKGDLNTPYYFGEETIFKVALDQYFVYVTNEDGTISCFDRRIEKTLTCVNTMSDNLSSRQGCLYVCEYHEGTLVVVMRDFTTTTHNSYSTVILNKNLEELTRKTDQIELSYSSFASCIKINEYDMFVGTCIDYQHYVKRYLMSNPIVHLDGLPSDRLDAIEYSPDRVLLLASHKIYHNELIDHQSKRIILNKRVDSTFNV